MKNVKKFLYGAIAVWYTTFILTWISRRIDKENRIVYAVEEDTVVIISCKGHYNDQ